MEDATDLQPAEDDVHIRREALERQAAIPLDRAAKPAEEEEDITNAYSAVLEVGLRGIDLSEERQPPARSRARSRLEIRIEMGAALWSDPLSCNRRDDGGEGLASPAYLVEARQLVRRYWEGAQRAIG